MIESDSWELVYPLECHDNIGPVARYAHTSVVHDNALWIFGGLNDLNITNDLWKWDFGKYSYMNLSKLN